MSRIHRAIGMLFGVSLLFACGCGRYQVGPAPLYPPDIATVYVPVFESDSYRRHVGERLTEAVVKEIEKRTPYKVVNTPDADSTLFGRIVGDQKRVLVETPTGEPREVSLEFFVQVSWINRRGDLVRQTAVPLAPEIVDVVGAAQVVPEAGESIASAQQRAIHRMAARIVDLMESPWSAAETAEPTPAGPELLPAQPTGPESLPTPAIP
ncbi:MAG: hypothetical protein HYS13_03520 [Planctomycetia bacterium]|nr:hypothetical protein [Planctomycetia bacterium]